MNVDGLTVTEIAYLANGPRHAARTGLATLFARGVVVAGRPGQVSRTATVPADVDLVERTLYVSLYGSMGLRELTNKPRVRNTMAEVQARLVRRGLLRPPWRRLVVPVVLVTAPPALVARFMDLDSRSVPIALAAICVLASAAVGFLPRRTTSGTRVLRRLRQRHADVLNDQPDNAGHRPSKWERVGLAVALYGDAGLSAALPNFARDGGLVDGGRSSRFLGDGPLHSSSHLDAWRHDTDSTH